MFDGLFVGLYLCLINSVGGYCLGDYICRLLCLCLLSFDFGVLMVLVAVVLFGLCFWFWLDCLVLLDVVVYGF